jgi:MYXO-CTERM domain-containing protein
MRTGQVWSTEYGSRGDGRGPQTTPAADPAAEEGSESPGAPAVDAFFKEMACTEEPPWLPAAGTFPEAERGIEPLPSSPAESTRVNPGQGGREACEPPGAWGGRPGVGLAMSALGLLVSYRRRRVKGAGARDDDEGASLRRG